MRNIIHMIYFSLLHCNIKSMRAHSLSMRQIKNYFWRNIMFDQELMRWSMYWMKCCESISSRLGISVCGILHSNTFCRHLTVSMITEFLVSNKNYFECWQTTLIRLFRLYHQLDCETVAAIVRRQEKIFCGNTMFLNYPHRTKNCFRRNYSC